MKILTFLKPNKTAIEIQNRKTDMQNFRAEELQKVVSLKGKSFLELGAQAAPTLLKDEADIWYLDYETKKEARKNFKDRPEMWKKIVETDILVKTDDYWKYTKQKFDCVIANHVIEHTNDIIYWLQSISRLLKKNGYIFLAIPDKKYSFDKYRSNTTFTHIVTDFFLGGDRSVPEHSLDIGVMYDFTYVGEEMNPRKFMNKDTLKGILNNTVGVGMHRHVFEPETFEHKIMAPILYSELVDLKIVHCDRVANRFGEFNCILQKGQQKLFNTEKFLK